MHEHEFGSGSWCLQGRQKSDREETRATEERRTERQGQRDAAVPCSSCKFSVMSQPFFFFFPNSLGTGIFSQCLHSGLFFAQVLADRRDASLAQKFFTKV